MKCYPIKNKTEYIPYDMMLEHEAQCRMNVQKTVEKSAKMGGISYLDAYFILKDEPFNMYMDTDDMAKLEDRARNLVQAMVYRWLMNNSLLDQIGG